MRKFIYLLLVVFCLFNLCSCNKKEEHVHSYTIKNIDEKYLKDAATCDSPSIYYYSCSCGEKGTETFEIGEALGHTFSDTWSSNETYHYHSATCVHTDLLKDKALHTYVDTGITRKNSETGYDEKEQKCSVCGRINWVVDHEHIYSEWEYKDDNIHERTCECGLSETEYHTVDEGVDLGDGYTTYTCTKCNHQFKIEKGKNKYAVIFYGYNDEQLASIQFTEGEEVELQYPKLNSVNGQRFIGWDTEIKYINTKILTNSLSVKAIYVDEYTFSFYNTNNECISTIKYAPEDRNEKKSNIKYPTINVEEGYTLTWDKTIEEIQNTNSDLSIHASINRNKYTVNFYNYDGTLLKTDKVLHGLNIKYPTNLTEWYYDYELEKSYILKGWNVIVNEKNIKTISINDESYTNVTDAITSNIDYKLLYEEGCIDPTIVISKSSSTKIKVSLLIPKGYFVNAFCFKLKYEIDGASVSKTLENSVFSLNKDDNMVINERTNEISYFYLSGTGEEIKQTGSYGIVQFEFSLSTSGKKNFDNEDLSKIFSLDSSESYIIYYENINNERTKNITKEFEVIFEK